MNLFLMGFAVGVVIGVGVVCVLAGCMLASEISRG